MMQRLRTGIDWGVYMEDEMAHAGAPRPEGLIESVRFGRYLRAARTIAGYDRVVDLADATARKTGVVMSEKTLYKVERGEQDPTFEQVVALVITIKPKGGLLYFLPAMNADAAEELVRE